MSSSKKKPMSEDVAKCIMHYIDPVKRILEFENHPFLSGLHKSTPLYLRDLVLYPSVLAIDSLGYSFSSILLHLDGEPLLQPVKDQNQRGGYPFDVTMFGEEMTNIPEQQGDIKIFGEWAPRFPGFREDDWPFDIVIRSQIQVNDKVIKRTAVKEKRICELMKELTENVLGGGRIHTLRCLHIGGETGVLRLPVGLKLVVQELIAMTNSLEVIEKISPILDHRSFPLNALNIRVTSKKDLILQNEKVRAAKTIKIGLPEGVIKEKWAPTLLTLQNDNIEIYENELGFKDVLDIVRHWKRNPRFIGNTFKFSLEKCAQTLIALRSLMDGVEGVIPGKSNPDFPTGALIPINKEVELVCHGIKSPPLVFQGKVLPFMVVMEVVEYGTGTPVGQVSSV